MKKIFLLVALVSSFGGAFAQYNVFMEILENKKICNKEDELTYFLQANAYERQNGDRYVHYYAEKGQLYTSSITNQNECYVIYATNDVTDYNRIKAAITESCYKEYAADKSVSYICNEKRIQDVQVIFSGYLQAEKAYEIMVYQNPEHHEKPYLPSNRAQPETKDDHIKIKPKAKKHYTPSRTTSPTTKPAAKEEKHEVAKPTIPATTNAASRKKVTKPRVTTTKDEVPSVIK